MTIHINCTVCNAPKASDIDADVAAGKSRPSIAKAFGVSLAALYRHIRGGHGVATPGFPSRKMKTGGSALDRARRVVEGLEAIDSKKLSPVMATKHMDAYRRAVESLAKVETQSLGASGTTESEWERKYRDAKEHVQIVAQVLTKFPEAEHAVRAAYVARRTGSRRAHDNRRRS